jgi:hypothetical protein
MARIKHVDGGTHASNASIAIGHNLCRRLAYLRHCSFRFHQCLRLVSACYVEFGLMIHKLAPLA